MIQSALRRATLLLAVLAASAAPAQATVQGDAATALVVIDQPRGGPSGTTLAVSGWAADPASASGTGIDRVDVYLDGAPDGGGTYLGRATYGLQRPDVAANLGSPRFTLSGFALQAAVTPGPHTVYVYARTPSGEIAGGAPKTAAVLAGAGGASAGGPGEIPVWTQVPVTARIPGVSGSYTFDVITNSAAYPPGPADTGGPIVAPPYYGYGIYGSILPYPNYPAYTDIYWNSYATTGWLPSSYALGYYGPYAPAYTYYSYGPPYSLYGSGFGLDALYYPNYYRRSWNGYLGVSGVLSPVYCPVYTYVFC